MKEDKMIYLIAITLAVMVIFLLTVLAEFNKRINYLQKSVDFLQNENEDLTSQLEFMNNLIKNK